MIKIRTIKSPVALAACGAFLVPEPLGACLVLAAAIWWLCRKIGSPCCRLLSLLAQVERTHFPSLRRVLPRRIGLAAVTRSMSTGDENQP